MLFWFFTSLLAAPLSEALRTYDCPKAIAMTPPSEYHFRLALGLCHAQKEQHQQALAFYSEPTKNLAPYAALLRAQSLYALREFKAAQEELSKAVKGTQKTLLEAKILLELGDRTSAKKQLNSLLTKTRGAAGFLPSFGDIDSAEIRWLLAKAAIDQGRIPAAIPVLYTIWTHNPTSIYSEKAERLLIELKEYVPDPSTDTGAAYIRTRISTLQKMRLYKEANAYVSLLPAAHKATSSSAYAAYQAREYADAIIKYDAQQSLSGDDMFHLAISLSRTGNYPRAAEVYTTLYTTYPKHKEAELASFKVPYLSFDQGEYAQAAPLFIEHRKRYPSDTPKTSWFLIWSLIKLNRTTEAISEIESLVSSYSKSTYAPYALHWKALLQKKLAQPYQETLSQVLQQYPTNGQAWFSLKESQKILPKPKPLIFPSLPAQLDVSAYHTGLQLAQAGFSLWAQEELSSLLPLATDKTSALILAHALIEAGDFTEAMKIAQPYCVAPEKGGDPLAQQACYPRPFSDTITTQLQNSTIPKLLPYAIMKAESAMQPDVRSVADARGLMQLMPFVGEAHHKRLLPNTPYDANFLFIAGYNARMGTEELKRLEVLFSKQPVDHSLPLIIAGYNGGPEAVERWMKRYTNTPILAEEFAEDVGYTETRKYVKRVLGYLMEYQYIYGTEE